MTQIGIDETSVNKEYQCIPTAIDLGKPRLLQAVPGRSKETVPKKAEYLVNKGCPTNQIEEVCIYFSTAFIAGSLEAYSEADITFDRFHVKKMLNEAMNKVRIAERREQGQLKSLNYTLLKSRNKLQALQVFITFSHLS